MEYWPVNILYIIYDLLTYLYIVYMFYIFHKSARLFFVSPLFKFMFRHREKNGKCFQLMFC